MFFSKILKIHFLTTKTQKIKVFSNPFGDKLVPTSSTWIKQKELEKIWKFF